MVWGPHLPSFTTDLDGGYHILKLNQHSMNVLHCTVLESAPLVYILLVVITLAFTLLEDQEPVSTFAITIVYIHLTQCLYCTRVVIWD